MPRTDGVKMKECPNCYGAGEQACGRCGQKTSDCETCAGTGEVKDESSDEEEA